MTGIRYRRLAVALVGVNASLLGLRYYRHGSFSARPGDDKSWAGSRGGRVMTAEEAAQRSEWLGRFRGEFTPIPDDHSARRISKRSSPDATTYMNADPRLTSPKTTPADLLLLPDDDDGRPPGARDPGYTIAPSPGKGMGLFATRFIPAHAPILDEEPVLVLPAGGAHMLRASDLHGFVAQVFALAPALRAAAATLQGERVALWRPQMEYYGEILRTEAFAVGDPPFAKSNVTDAAATAAAPDASSSTCGGESQETVVARRPRPLSLEERSELEHILRVFYTNAAALVAPLSLSSSPSSPSSTPSAAAAATASNNTTTTTTKMAHVADGLFLTFSRINHACDPNAVWDTCRRRPGVMAIRAARDIRPGEEITIAYFWETTMAEEELAVEQRRARTLGWGFVCQCLKCGPLVGGSSAVE